MSASAPAVNLEFDLPAAPASLMQLSALLRDPDADMFAIAAVIENDLSYAAAVMRAVNSPLYGLAGRVHSVQQAVTYLGVRELSAIAYEAGLRASFPQVPELAAVWDRARVRGLLMGRLAQMLALEAWGAHSAGLFEEVGKAVLYRHAPGVYARLLRESDDDVELVESERRLFEAGHDEIGARLCEAWGLSQAAVTSVRHHVNVNVQHHLPRVSHRYLCVLSALADTLVRQPDQVEALAEHLAPQAMMDITSLLRALGRVKDKLAEVVEIDAGT